MVLFIGNLSQLEKVAGMFLIIITKMYYTLSLF
jgi:hypothetical protein